MSESSAIEWTGATWNPVTGCTKLSPACAHCYIERTPPFRMHGRKFVRGAIPLMFHENRLMAPVKWSGRMVFVNSLSDLFHPDVPEAFINEVYETMEHRAPQHTYQVLTKRAERMRDYLNWRYGGRRIPSRHIWHGVSAENQRMLVTRADCLRQTRSAVRFISAEPLLGPLEAQCYLPLLDWVIVGGESGPHTRPSDPAWFRSIRDQCRKVNVAFFMKQMTGKKPIPPDLLVREYPRARTEAA